MFARFGRRLIEGAVALFALLGFACVPLGEHTGLEHLQAIAATPAAKRAAHELYEAGTRVRREVLEAVFRGKKPRPDFPAPRLGAEPENAKRAPAAETPDASAPFPPSG